MTIQRQYVLPNCSLLLEGLSTDTSNVLSVLANAEFKIVGLDQPLAGGTDFFKAIVGAVSAYCQRLLSGLDHPGHVASQSALVSMEPGDGQYHRLLLKPELLGSEGGSSQPQAITLSTVQLFDMAEAIDQFFADSQTLPEFSVPLAPLARRYVRSQEPLTERALPPVLGIATLAAAGFGLFFLPVPEVLEETLTQPAALEEPAGEPLETTPPGTVDSQTSTVESAAAADEDTAERVPLTNDQLEALQQQVQQQVSAASPVDATFEQPLSYDISVAENGDILGYDPVDSVSAENIDNTPLPALTYIPVDSPDVNPAAQFNLTFDGDGAVTLVPKTAAGVITPEPVALEETEETPEPLSDEAALETVTPEVVIPDSTADDSPAESSVSAPATDSPEEAASTAAGGELSFTVDNKIQDPDLIYDLNQELRSTIIRNRTEDWSAPEVSYRIRLDESGQVVGYEANNDAAAQEADALKIPSLVNAENSSQPQLDFLVVIGEDDIVEVNPWDGWP